MPLVKKTNKRPRVIADLNAGVTSSKTRDLVVKPKHSNVDFYSLERKIREQYEKHHRTMVEISGLANLHIRKNTTPLRFLRKQEAGKFDHMHGHFMLRDMPYKVRREFYAELMRTMKPGARFYSVDTIQYRNQFAAELRKAGFEVTVRPVSMVEVQEIGTEASEANLYSAAVRKMRMSHLARASVEELREASGNPKVKNAVQVMAEDIKTMRRYLKKTLRRLDGKWNSLVSREIRAAHKRIIKDMDLWYANAPFVIIKVRKPKSR